MGTRYADRRSKFWITNKDFHDKKHRNGFWYFCCKYFVREPDVKYITKLQFINFFIEILTNVKENSTNLWSYLARWTNLLQK